MIHIAVDIGASGGKVFTGKIDNSMLDIKEVHRFTNGFSNKQGTLYWDVDHLLHETLIGLEKVRELGYEQCTLGIDTWAVDYVLVGDDNKRLKEMVSYRDRRTENTIGKLTKDISKEKVYHKTGIQLKPFNTLYQLYEENKEVLEEVEKILLLPDYLNFLLTENKVMESTNASCTQLLNIHTRKLDEELLSELGLKSSQFANLVKPGNELGYIKKDWFSTYNLPKVKVINVASHDTASAVAGTPGVEEGWAYLSSGTWSLLGIESDKPIISDLSLKGNYTNEWGVNGTYRFLKNIMGMWIIQEVQRGLSEFYSFNELVELAKTVDPFQQYVDFNDNRFLKPTDMISEIQFYCLETKQKVPQTTAELAACVYYNLAIIYAIALEELEVIASKKINRLYIVGGGGQNDFLNQLTADLSNKNISVGPTEATAIGNILVQMISEDEIKDLTMGRKLIAKSFLNKDFVPGDLNRETIINEFKKIKYMYHRSNLN